MMVNMMINDSFHDGWCMSHVNDGYMMVICLVSIVRAEKSKISEDRRDGSSGFLRCSVAPSKHPHRHGPDFGDLSAVCHDFMAAWEDATVSWTAHVS